MGRTCAALAAAILACLIWTGAAGAQAPTASDFQKVTLDDNTQNPMQLDVAPDGRVFYIERDGRVQIWKPDTRQTVTAGKIPVTLSQENGLLGIALAPDFAFSKWVYLFYSQLPDNTLTQVISRFKVNGDTLDLSSEQKILTFQHQTDQCCHSSGALGFGPDGSLYASTGDNTNPFDSDGFAPLDEQPGREHWDSQRTAANTNDLNGKILHIMPMAVPLGAPGVNTTYTIPANNLFPVGTAKTRPEIFGMGFRNPFRFTVDKTTGWVLMGDYGPDASTTNPNRGPQGSVEFNVLSKAGNYGWPYCIRDNTPYNDYNFATKTSGAKFDCSAPVNESPNNTGLTNLPPAIGASAWMGYTEQDSRFTPDLGTGGAPMGGPRYHYDPSLVSDRKFPAYYDNKWFVGEWNNNWIKTADLTSDGKISKFSAFAAGTGYKRPMDIKFGPDGALYVIEWGSGFNGDNADSGIYRIDYTAGDKAPIADATGTPTAGLAPLTVQFKGDASHDPEGGPITYAWDFNGDGNVDSTDPNPSYTYTTNGAFTAKLTVKDQNGLTGVENIPITVGNRAPVITFQTPIDGQAASFTDTVPYKVSVSDPEDGTTGNGISCDDVKVTVSLGHDQHAHDLASTTGCEGTLHTGLTSGHGPEANTFTVITVTYTDKGGPGGIVPLTGRGQVILQPKTKQAEFFASTGRVPNSATSGDAGVTTEDTSDDQGGGKDIGFIEDGDYVSYKPVNLTNLNELRFRVASAGAGGTIEVHLDSPTGTLVGTTDTITPTGGWQTFKTVSLPLTNPPSGTHELFLVFRNRGSTQNLFNVNWIEFVGKGAAVTAAPDVTASADKLTGTAPLTVKFTATATDPDGPATDLSYAWDFGVPGTDADKSTDPSPTYTYANSGNYLATLTVSDKQGGVTTKSFTVSVTPASSCNTAYRDDFNGSALDPGWSVVRQSQALNVGGGTLNITTENGDVYTNSNTAKNLVLRTAPSGPWTATIKLNEVGNVQYHQAGLIVYGDDDNYTKFDRLATNASGSAATEKFEFINEVAGTARNTSADASSNLPSTYPADFYMKIESDGTQIKGYSSTDGTTWTQVGQAANLPSNAKIGVFALDNAAATHVTAKFDYFQLDSGSGGGSAAGPGDDFNGTSLNKTVWNSIVREDATKYAVNNGALTITTVGGDIYTNSDPSGTRNFLLQSADHTSSDYVLETKLSGTLSGGYAQGGIIAYTDDDNFVKLDAISDTNQTVINRIELRSEVAGATANPQPQVNVPSGTANIWLRLTKAGTSYSGEYSFDGSTWTSIGDPVAHTQSAAKFGLYTLGVQDTTGKTVSFDYFKVNGSTGCGGGGGGNASPVITSATATPTAGFAPLQVAFNAAATDADNDTLTYSWDYDGDGTADATGATPSTTFNTAGTRNVKLTVSDGKGGTATKTIPVQVLAGDDANARFRALVFSKTTAFRHDAIPTANALLTTLGQQKNFQVDETEDASLFTDAVLSHYDVVIFNSTTGDPLNDDQQAAFERFIRAGHGYVGIHSAADTEYDWHWYGQLVGGYFRNHPDGTPTATVVVEDTENAANAGIPARWTRTDEWYNYKKYDNSSGDDYSPRNTPGVHVLLKMDESTYAENDGSDGTDDDHPISWCQRYDGGRSWYTGMGHTQATYSDPLFQNHLETGIEVAAGVKPDKDCGVTSTPPDSTNVDVPVGGNVPTVLALNIGAVPSLGTFQPGVAKDYEASVSASVVSSASAAALTVRDTSATATGRLVNGTAALTQPLQVNATDATQTTSAFAPLSTTGAALPLLALSTPVGLHPVTIGFKQPIAATEGLLRGNYAKTLTFTLSATTP
ncbi:ThuA domain-containing protein [Solirubrobacter soli]|uniref:ThuA domain-containing protein n=1 Tax=Solirubrobacter soli TaxID=363832 RepID=UPI00040C61D9|nr:ThuA domain-containing protein [Solirubrobacter soli]